MRKVDGTCKYIFLILGILLLLTGVGSSISFAAPEKKEDKKLTDIPSHHNIVSTVQKFFEQDIKSVETKIAQHLYYVKNGTMSPMEFYQKLAEMDLPAGKEARHVLQKVKKDIHNQLGQEGLDQILGKKNPQGGSLVETRLLGFRQETFMASVKKVCRDFQGRTTKNGHKFKVFFAEIGSWSSKTPDSLTFDMDIDACLLSGDLALALEMKTAIEAELKATIILTAEAFDTPVTAHGMAEHEVYLGKHGQAFAEEYLKTNQVYEIKEGQLRNGEGEGINGRKALTDVVLDRKFADVKLADLIHVKHPTEPGISLEMLRHFEHDIKNQNVAGDIDAFIKSAKYLERSFTALNKEFGIEPGSMGNSRVNTEKLSSFVDQLIAVKEGRLPNVEPVDLIRQYFKGTNQEIPFDIKLGPENTKGLTKVQIETKESIIKGFWDDCSRVMWDNAVKGFELNLKKINKFMTPKDAFTAKKHNQTIKKLYEMMAIENMVLHNADIGVKNIPPQFEKLMKKFDADYKSYTSKWGIELLDGQAKAQMNFIKKNIEVSSKNNRNKNIDLAMASLLSTFVQAPLKLNSYLDILDDTLMNDLHTGKFGGKYGKFEDFLIATKQATLSKRVGNFLEGTGFEKQWKKVHQGKYKNLIQEGNKKYASLENGLNKLLLDNRAARGIRKINRPFSEGIENSRGVQGAMAAMALISLKDELPVYYDALKDGNWEKFAVEFYRRRIPGSGTVENIVMGKYLSAAWSTVTTLLPPAALVNSVYAISNEIGSTAYKAVWTEELNLFIDELYENAKFSVVDIEKQGYDLTITHWKLKTVEYNHTEIDIAEEIQKHRDQAREMDEWWAEHSEEDPAKRTVPFPSHKFTDNLTNLMKVNEMLLLNIRANDPVLMYLDEILREDKGFFSRLIYGGENKTVKLGYVTELYFVYMHQIRWAKVKLQFLDHLKEELEKRRSAETIVLKGDDQKVLDELTSIAAKLGIKDEVIENLKNEVGGGLWEKYAWARDWFHSMKRDHFWEPELWEEYKEKIKVTAFYLETYKNIWNARKKLEAAFTMGKEDKERIRIFTGPEFLTGTPKEDAAIAAQWQETVTKAYREIKDKLEQIKSKYVQTGLNLSPDSYDAKMLVAISSAEIVKKMYIWSFRHLEKTLMAKYFSKPKQIYEEKKEMFRQRAQVLEAEKKRLIEQFENYYQALDTKKLDKIEKELDAAQNLSESVKNACTEAEKTATDLSVKMEAGKKELVGIEAELVKLFKKTGNQKKETEAIKKAHLAMEKQAAKAAETAHELEQLSLKICERTKTLNNYKISDADHAKNYKWIKGQKKQLKALLTSVKQMVKNAEKQHKTRKKQSPGQAKSDEKISKKIDENLKKEADTAKTHKESMDKAASEILTGAQKASEASALKSSSQTALEKLEKDIAALTKTGLGKKMEKRIQDLKKKAESIQVEDCGPSMSQKIKSAGLGYQKNQDMLKKVAAFYESVKKGMDKTAGEQKIFDQKYKEISYLIDLAKAYAERAENAAVDGALCTVLADDIMEKVFIPNVSGVKLGKALPIIRQKGFSVVTVKGEKPPSKELTLRVHKQTPDIRRRAARGSEVVVYHYDKIPEETALDCSQWPGSQELVDLATGKRKCGCYEGKVWNADQTACVAEENGLPSTEEIMQASRDLRLTLANCWRFPGSEAKWDDARNDAVCVCKPGLVWNKDDTKCLGKREAAMEKTNCSKFPGTIVVWDYANNRPGCDCPKGSQWVQARNQCMDKREIALANLNCSSFPNTRPVWNEAQKKAVCECIPGTVLNKNKNGCIDSKQAALENMDCRRWPGSIPMWDEQKNQPSCGCPSGTQWVQNENKCMTKQQVAIKVEQAQQVHFVGSYTITNPARSYKIYHGSLILYQNGKGGAKEYNNNKPVEGKYPKSRDSRGYLPVIWSYKNQIFTLDWTCNGRYKGLGRFSGNVKGNTNHFVLNGHWAGGRSGKIKFRRK